MTTTAPPASIEALPGHDARGSGDPFDPTGQAALLASVPPGLGLLSLLENLDVGAADSATLLEAIAGWERLKSRAEAALSRLYVHFVDQVAADPLLPASQAPRHARAEIACRLAISGAAAGRRLDSAYAIDAHPTLADSLGEGFIDPSKAKVLVNETDHLPRHRSAAVIDLLLPEAPELTPTQLRDKVRKTLLEADPDTADVRHAKARKQRTMWREAAPDGMAYLHVFDTAPNIEAAFASVTTLAGRKSAEDDRTAGARRTDALITLLTGRTSERSAAPRAQAGGHDAGDDDEARGGAAGLAEADGPDDGADTRSDSASDLLRAVLDRLPECRVHLNVTVGAGTILGLDDRPAYLAGYGFLPARLARELAADATWRAILTCPRTGEFLHRSSRTYRPGLVLAAHVATRDVTCTFPGCDTPAVACDLDHIEPFSPDRPPEDQTCEHNLHPLCRNHHLVKTHGRWTPTRDDDGFTHWASPTGHSYVRPPVALAGHPGDIPRHLSEPDPEETWDGPDLFPPDIDDEAGYRLSADGAPCRVPVLPAPPPPPPFADAPIPAAIAAKPVRVEDKKPPGTEPTVAAGDTTGQSPAAPETTSS